MADRTPWCPAGLLPRRQGHTAARWSSCRYGMLCPAAARKLPRLMRGTWRSLSLVLLLGMLGLQQLAATQLLHTVTPPCVGV